MAKNSARVQLNKIVPIAWLTDYLDMLRSYRNAPAAPGLTPEQLLAIKALDEAFDQRIAEVSAYLKRLNQSTVIN